MSRKYRKPFLADVVARIDFAFPIVEFDNPLPPNFSSAIRKFFPVLEPNEVIAQGFRIDFDPESGARASHEQTKEIEWRFFSTDRDKMLSVTRDFIVISYKSYESFAVLKNDFIGVLQELFKTKPDVQIRRFGLRYINIIDLNENQPTKWHIYLNPNLLSIFKVPPDSSLISRAFHSLQLNLERDVKMHFQYGMHNPDFPALIRRKQFVLDYDAYFEGLLQSISEISEYLELFHDNIERLFEGSIKEKLRVIMNG